MQGPMQNNRELPEHPFLGFIEQALQETTVAKALVALQHKLGVNYNIFLFCCWFAMNQFGRLALSDISTMLHETHAWRSQIIDKLTHLSNLTLIKANDIRTLHWRRELIKEKAFAEKVEQLMLVESLHRNPRSEINSKQQLADICKNIHAYCKAMHIIIDASAFQSIESLLLSLLTDYNPDEIRKVTKAILYNERQLATPKGRQLQFHL